jgi:NMD protein affecting ribosome stability and mRNA decay
MIKYICDKCGKEIDKFLLSDCMIMSVTGQYVKHDKSEIILCENCKEKFNNWIEGVKNE